MSESEALTLFRITQECLTNIAKHASANQVTVKLLIEQNTAILTVIDDGIADALPMASSTGIGLLGIRERVAAMNGQLEFAVVEPHGLMVEVSLPLNFNNE